MAYSLLPWLSGIAVFSGTLYLIIFNIPLCFLLCLHLLNKKLPVPFSRPRHIVYGQIYAAILGLSFQFAVSGHIFKAGYRNHGLHSMFNGFVQFISYFDGWFFSYKAIAFFLIFVIAFFVCVYVGLSYWCKAKSSLVSNSLHTDFSAFLGLFLVLSLCAIISVSLLTKAFDDASHLRYICTSVLLIPSVGLLLYLNFHKSPTQIIICIILLGLAIFGGFLQYKSGLIRLGSLKQTFDYRPFYVACLDSYARQYGIRNGLADYWSFREINLLSRRRVFAASISASGGINPWLINLASYFPGGRFSNRYSFVLTRDFSPFLWKNVLENRFGKPNKVVYCGKDAVLLYTGKVSRRALNLSLYKQYVQMANLSLMRVL